MVDIDSGCIEPSKMFSFSTLPSELLTPVMNALGRVSYCTLHIIFTVYVEIFVLKNVRG